MALTFLLLVSVPVLCSATRNEFVESDQELKLRLISRESTPMWAAPGAMANLEFELRNNGPAGSFVINQQGEHNMMGMIPIARADLPKDTVHTINIQEIPVPIMAEGTKVEFTVSAEREVHTPGAKMDSVELTVLFHIGELESDTTKPDAQEEFGGTCPVARNSTQCNSYKWQMEYHVEDTSSGLKFIDIQSIGKDSYNFPVYTRYPNFKIGSNERIDVLADVSCCVAGILLTVTDVAGNQVQVETLEGSNSGMTAFVNLYLVLIALVFTRIN